MNLQLRQLVLLAILIPLSLSGSKNRNSAADNQAAAQTTARTTTAPATQPAATGKVYWVDGSSPAAADTNPGTEAKPWKMIARAGGAKELKPGDTVRIKAGVYRESAVITVRGEPGKPITFEAAPGA